MQEDSGDAPEGSNEPEINIIDGSDQGDSVDARHQGKARGGIARAQNLSSEKRSEIARKAAAARWQKDLGEAICGSPDQPLKIGNVELECYVLADGTRVLTQATFLQALGRHRRVNARQPRGQELPPILKGQAILPYLTPEIIEKAQPIKFGLPRGGRASGYNAELLPVICEVYLKARDSQKLPSNQDNIAKQAEILVRALAHVGIIALVDEATGYQEFRAKDALTKILEAFIDKELQPWIRTFPNDFYAELFRLRGLEYPKATVQRPRYFGGLTNDIVYRRLAPGVLNELKKETPRNDSGRLRHKYFQRLTSNIGYPKLREHLGSVVSIMKLSKDWDTFMAHINRLHPRFGDTIELPLDIDGDKGFGL